MASHIQSPFEWWWNRSRASVGGVGTARPEEYWAQARSAAPPEIRRIGLADLRAALESGVDDFAANRSDVIFLCLLYPIIGLVLGRLAFGYGMLPL
ncbi:MAG TPA: transporter, partial [Stellaceae bacterium]|nr:transporter [Stellaceae bacterium]